MRHAWNGGLQAQGQGRQEGENASETGADLRLKPYHAPGDTLAAHPVATVISNPGPWTP